LELDLGLLESSVLLSLRFYAGVLGPLPFQRSAVFSGQAAQGSSAGALLIVGG